MKRHFGFDELFLGTAMTRNRTTDIVRYIRVWRTQIILMLSIWHWLLLHGEIDGKTAIGHILVRIILEKLADGKILKFSSYLIIGVDILNLLRDKFNPLIIKERFLRTCVFSR